MSIILPALFTIAAVLAFATISRAIVANLPAIMELRQRMSKPEYGTEVIVTLREQLGGFDAVAALRRPRPLRHPSPKPITHRLHHFAKFRVA